MRVGDIHTACFECLSAQQLAANNAQEGVECCHPTVLLLSWDKHLV